MAQKKYKQRFTWEEANAHIAKIEQENAALRAALAELTTAVEEGDPQAIADVVGQVKGMVNPHE